MAEGQFGQEETGWSREVAVERSDPESLTAGGTAGDEEADRTPGAQAVEPGQMAGLSEEGKWVREVVEGRKKMTCLGPHKSSMRLYVEQKQFPRLGKGCRKLCPGPAGMAGNRDSVGFGGRCVWVSISPPALTISMIWAIYPNCFLVCKMEFSLYSRRGSAD